MLFSFFFLLTQKKKNGAPNQCILCARYAHTKIDIYIEQKKKIKIKDHQKR